MIRDLSSASPVEVNGRPLGNGHEARLAGGDEIRIGGYVLRVLDEVAKAAPPPAPRDDPLAMFGPASADPFADLLSPPPSARQSAGVYGGEKEAPARHETIPTDFDPFADLMAPPPSSDPFDCLLYTSRCV